MVDIIRICITKSRIVKISIIDFLVLPNPLDKYTFDGPFEFVLSDIDPHFIFWSEWEENGWNIYHLVLICYLFVPLFLVQGHFYLLLLSVRKHEY